MLFERSGPNIRLTRVGDELFRIALPVVMDMERLPETFAERYRGISSGRLAIGTSTTCAAKMVAGYLKRFREEHDGVRTTVKVGSGTDRITWLRAHEVELAFGAMDVVPPDMELRRLFTSEAMLITPLGHPLAGRTDPSPAEVASFPMIAHPPGHYLRTLMDGVARHLGVRLDVVMELGAWDVIKRHVEMGVGIAVVPEIALDESDRVGRTSLVPRIPRRHYGVYWRREGTLSRLAQEFLELVEPGTPAPV